MKSDLRIMLRGNVLLSSPILFCVYRHLVKMLYAVVLTLNLVLSPTLFAFDEFLVSDIRIEGLDRITPATVLSYLPVKKNDFLTAELASNAIRELFKTSFFRDVRLEREGNTLVVFVQERPAIANITFTGNDSIDTEELTKALKSVGFAVGNVFDQGLLDRVQLELQRRYFADGRYAAKITPTVKTIENNRVDITIQISEGAVARIRQITVVGNQVFTDSELIDLMTLQTGGWLSWFTRDDQYSRQKLSADLEAIRSFYQDRGYLNFNMDSAQVSITPDKKDVYITLNLTEGDKFTVSDVQLVGNLVVPEAELLKKVSIKAPQIFSRKEVTATTEALVARIGEEGYAFANINAVPEINKEQKTVALKFFIDPGRRVYVRRINFKGNTKTRDEVMRREMRQMEGAVISTKQVKRSLERLELLDYFESVTVETPVVPDNPDLIDINYTVIEKPSGNLLAGLGFSQTQGLLINLSVLQDNFLGSGKRVGVSFNNSDVNTIYSFSYFDPYTTVDGVSRGFSLFSRQTDAEEANLSRYTTDVYGGTLTYGIPISEFNNIRVGFEYDNTVLKTTVNSATEIFDFIDKYGEDYNSYRLVLSWSSDTRNRAMFADEGSLQSFSAEVALPVSDLSYYKLSYRHQWLYSLFKDYTLLLKGEVGYGEGYGDTEDLPFFENYTVGGPRSVRGFKENTLSPLDSNGRPFGGNLKVVGNAELILPLPFVKTRAFRVSAFFDIGNAFGSSQDFEVQALRYSTGLAALWLSPLGVLSFSYAYPLKTFENDQTQAFQFSIGTTF